MHCYEYNYAECWEGYPDLAVVKALDGPPAELVDDAVRPREVDLVADVVQLRVGGATRAGRRRQGSVDIHGKVYIG